MPRTRFETLIDVCALSFAAYLTIASLSRSRPRSAAQRQGRARLARRLLAKHAGSGKPLKLSLVDREVEVAADVVVPEDISISFADIGGLASLAKQLQDAILLPVLRPELFRQSKLLCPPRGILLHGPPGTGKTMLARAIAREAKHTFLNLNPARLLSKWYGLATLSDTCQPHGCSPSGEAPHIPFPYLRYLTVPCASRLRYGESNKYAEAYFTLATKLAPSIIFIDEVDLIWSDPI